MTEQKQPQAGEYWQKDGKRLCVIGTTKNGLTVGETESGNLIPFLPVNEWQHLPDCDSFDWRPDPYPHYYESLSSSMAYARRDSETTSTLVRRDGVEFDDKWYSTTSENRTRITEAEALARVKPAEVYPQYWTAKYSDSNRDAAFVELKQGGDWVQHYRDGGEYLMTVVPFQKKGRKQLTKGQAEALLDRPQESPDDWVTQDRVPPRHGIDQVQWSSWESSRWMDAAASGWLPSQIHGYRDEDDATVLSVRCLRKDLPPLPSPKRVAVRLWCETTVSDGDCNGVFAHQDEQSSCREIKHDANGFYVEVQP